MPTFSFKPVEKLKKQSNTTNKTKEFEIVQRKVSGVVYITPDFSYKVIIKKKEYNLTPNSFNCKGKRYIYAQFLNNKQRVCIIRNSENRPDYNKYFFAPFAAGSVVIGHIVVKKDTKEELFDFKKVITDVAIINQHEIHDALSYWRKNEKTLANVRNDCITKYYEST